MHTYPRTYQHMHAGTAVFVAHTLFQAPAAHLSVDHCALFLKKNKEKGSLRVRRADGCVTSATRPGAGPEGQRVEIYSVWPDCCWTERCWQPLAELVENSTQVWR